MSEQTEQNATKEFIAWLSDAASPPQAAFTLLHGLRFSGLRTLSGMDRLIQEMYTIDDARDAAHAQRDAAFRVWRCETGRCHWGRGQHE